MKVLLLSYKTKSKYLCNYHKQFRRSILSVNGKWEKLPFEKNFQIYSLMKDIEEYWKPIVAKHWENVLQSPPTKSKKRYILSMFPYPSGSLHLGHLRIYTTSDILARMSYLRQFDVIHPMGWDAFGLPAENAAIDRGISPKIWTNQNISQMRKQFLSVAYQFNWREKTSDPSYYKWTQWLFLQLYKSNLVYKSTGFVNWDPVDRTVLADEQIDAEGKSWRSGAVVERRHHRQWYIKTNAFAKDLYEAKDMISEYKMGQIIRIQRGRLGKPSGYLFYLPLKESQDTLLIYTKFPEIFLNEKSFIAISPDHWLSTEVEKKKIFAFNPFTQKPIDVRLINNYELPYSTKATILSQRECFPDEDIRNNILNIAKEQNIGGYLTSETYRDWLISRQRYWGTPIPMVYCKTCQWQPVPEEDLPLELPEIDFNSIKDFRTDEIAGPLQNAPPEWLNTKCPKCNALDARRETDTCDTLFDSSWYFLRYFTEPSEIHPFEKDQLRPVWCYVGGLEHADLHLLYARFITHFLYQKHLLPFREPFDHVIGHGVVKSKTYTVNGKYISEKETANYDNVVTTFEKMSKSKGNGVEPGYLIERYGVDANRLCLLHFGNPLSHRLWKGDVYEFQEIRDFLRRIYITVEEFREIKVQEKEGTLGKNAPNFSEVRVRKVSPKEIQEGRKNLFEQRSIHVHNVMKKFEITYSIQNGVHALIDLLSTLRKYARTNVALAPEYEHCLADFLIMISPIMPHFAAECWKGFSEAAEGADSYDIKKTILEQQWPKVDPTFMIPIKLVNKSNEVQNMIFIARKEIPSWSMEAVLTILDKLKIRDFEKISIFEEIEIFIVLNDNHMNEITNGKLQKDYENI